jgi:hypothetical protein
VALRSGANRNAPACTARFSCMRSRSTVIVANWKRLSAPSLLSAALPLISDAEKVRFNQINKSKDAKVDGERDDRRKRQASTATPAQPGDLGVSWARCQLSAKAVAISDMLLFTNFATEIRPGSPT